MKKILFLVKIIVFCAFFYIACVCTAFFVREDTQSYTRAMFKEFYSQEKIDVLFCGASHVSHGLYPKIMDERLGVNTFCTGTPKQRIDGTYAIIQEAIGRYKIKEIWIEMDFAVAILSGSFKESNPSQSTFLITSNLRNPKAKLSLLLNSTAPKHWINTFCPIGTVSLVDLDPIKIMERLFVRGRRLVKGEDFDIGSGHSYGGKGCVLDYDSIENGTFTSRFESPIDLNSIKGDFEKYIRLIIECCEKNNVKLVFYCQPQSDYYLVEKSNYDDYHKYIENLIEPNRLIDFNYLKPEILFFNDEDYYDDNHLNKNGIIKFTNCFCDFYNSGFSDDMFCSSFNEKLSLQKSKVLGLMLEEVDRKKLKIKPIINNNDYSKVVLKATFDGESKNYTCNDEGLMNIDYPQHSYGYVELETFYDGVSNHKTKYYYSSL